MITSQKLLPVHKRFDIKFERGEGMYLFDSENNKYLDFGSGIAVNALGHCHPALVSALSSQASKLWHVSNIYNSSELNRYAEKLVSKTIFDYVFFCNSGAEAVECAIKMARKHFYVKNKNNPKKNNKYRIITFSGAFHGRTIATISATGNQKYLEGFLPALDGFDQVKFLDIEAVKAAITEETAAILIEPIQGESGVKPAGKEFLKELRKICDENDILLIFDEIQCGFGRTGMLFAYEYYDVSPDIITLAKSIACGYPLGACLAKKEVADAMTAGSHGTTYGGNPLAMSVANAVLESYEKEKILENVRENEFKLKSSLESLKKEFQNIISEIRGVGYMFGVKINENIEHNFIVSELIKNKLLTIPAGDNVIRIMPPLIAKENHIKEAKDIIYQTLKNVQ